jgi:hypothetical protein
MCHRSHSTVAAAAGHHVRRWSGAVVLSRYAPEWFGSLSLFAPEPANTMMGYESPYISCPRCQDRAMLFEPESRIAICAPFKSAVLSAQSFGLCAVGRLPCPGRTGGLLPNQSSAFNVGGSSSDRLCREGCGNHEHCRLYLSARGYG